MGDLFKVILDKINDIVFEIMGLILPAFVLSILIYQPALYMATLPCYLNILNDKANTLYLTLGNWEIVIAVVMTYLLGHVIKIISMEYYSIMIILFKLLNEYIVKFKLFLKELVKKLISSPNFFKIVLSLILNISIYLITLADKITNYTVKGHDSSFDRIEEQVNETLLSKIGDKAKDKYDWYVLYKISCAISSNENRKSLTSLFLAKYNSYRSLEVVFFVSIIYNCLISNYYWFILNPIMFNIIIILNLLFWYTFHIKYQRYWKLCGNEALVDIAYSFYFNDISGGNTNEK